MNIKELMVGDWVNLSKGNWSENRQVELIDIEMIAESVYLAEPIPLTPEILEKNGFIHGYGDSDFYDYEKWEKKVDDKTIRVIKDHGWFCRVDDNKLTRSMGIAPAVHTMQNIIRIGGIDKTIEL